MPPKPCAIATNEVVTTPLTVSDKDALAQLERWAGLPGVEPECLSLATRCARHGPAYEVNYGVYIDGRLVGGIATSGEYFNVMWLHADYRGRGVGHRAARSVIARQLAQYECAIVNEPNERMCRTLVSIMTKERAREARIGNSVPRLTFKPGDLS